MSKFLFLALFIFQLNLANAKGTEIKKDPHNKGLLSSVNLGIRYSSILENRGVIFYKDFQIDPVLGLFFLDDRVEFLGDSFGFRDFVAGKWLRLRTRLVSLSDDPLFPVKENFKSEMPDREDTYEWSNRVEFFLSDYDENYWAEINLGYAKDISVHKGDYADLQAKIKLTSYRLALGNTLVEPNLYTGVGWGDSKHNQYFYGPSAVAGFNNLTYGLWFAFPEEADRFYPILKISRFEVLGKSKHAEFAKNGNEGWLFSFIATFGILE